MIKEDINSLPKEFRLSYEIINLFFSNIVSTYNSCIDSRVFETTIELKLESHSKELNNLKGDDLFEWLIKNEYFVDHYLLSMKLIVSALIKEFIAYIGESLNNILKNNLSITYTLLRKPLKEILTYLEIICYDPYIFYKKFYHTEARSYNPSEKTAKEKMEVIKIVMEKIKILNFFTPSVLYDLRFNKSNVFSFDRYCTQAIHLITDDKDIKTDKNNINFIFSNDEDKYSQLYQIFYTLPIILYYTNYLIEDVINIFANSPEEDKYKQRLDYGMILWSIDTHSSKTTIKKIHDLMNSQHKEKDIICPGCNTIINFDKDFLYNFVFQWAIICEKCSWRTDLNIK